MGARELDMVMNYEQLLAGDFQAVYMDVVAVRMAAPPPTVLKVILETSQLEKHDIIAGCKIASVARADFVKTSTGFRGQGATEENVKLMKAAVEHEGLRVKASGGVKTIADAIKMIEAGADRIGSSSGVWIMKESKGRVDNITHEVTEGSVSPPPPQPSLTRLYTDY
jgi:deoxyribose-phosphate aldolase